MGSLATSLCQNMVQTTIISAWLLLWFMRCAWPCLGLRLDNTVHSEPFLQVTVLPACQATNFTYQHFFTPDAPYRTVFATEEGHDIIEVTCSAAEQQDLCFRYPGDYKGVF